MTAPERLAELRAGVPLSNDAAGLPTWIANTGSRLSVAERAALLAVLDN